jgi:hypothetical protein
MTCRYAHKRVATLFTLIQAMPAARVIDWPQKSINSSESRARTSLNGKPRETSYANK